MKIIDALLITIGLDTKKLEEGSKKAQDALAKTGRTGGKANQELADGAKEVAKTLEKVKNQALAVTSVMLGASGLKSFVQGTISANIQTGNLSKTLGTSIGELDKWQRAVKRVGGSPDGMAASLRAVSDAVSNSFNFGQSSSIVEAMRKFFGHDLKIDKNGIIDLTDFMLKAADRMAKMSPNQAMGFGRQLGLDDSTILLLMKGRKELQGLLVEMEKIGPLTSKDYEESLKAAAAWDTMSESAQRLANTLTIKLAPAASGVFDAVTRLMHDPRDFATRVAEFYGLRAKSYDRVELTPEAERRTRRVSGKVVDEVSGASFGTLAERNNNPGNLRFAGQAGAAPGRGGFAAFLSRSAGLAALARQLSLYGARGISTISDIVNTYAPASDGNNTAAYIRHLMQTVGTGANDRLNMGDPHVMAKLMRGIVDHEGRNTISDSEILAISLGSRGRFGGRGAAGGQTSVSVGPVTIVTQATDTKGIARDFARETNRALVAQANSGVN